MSETVIGIDLGTTNSEVAALVDGRVQVLGPPEGRLLPSVVGLAPSGELLVGRAARNQLLVYPERTVKSIKRKMGQAVEVRLGDKKFSPAEISSLILRTLVDQAERSLGERPHRAVITVPAYFSDAQRQATREAGALAGLEVLRILNEPTAASLAYVGDPLQRQTLLVYDLGGGTFDVSIVTLEGEITEVLASHGNNALGGDDFDQLLADRLARRFEEEHGIDLRQGHAAAWARIVFAAEEAKKKLSFEPYAAIREEALVLRDGRGLHLEMEVSRDDYETLIVGLVESTLESVTQALVGAGRKASDLDGVLLVGGSTRTPLVREVLQDRIGREPRHEIHPDLCVALGAGVLASRLAGHAVERILVDVSPYSFGPSFLGERGGVPYPHCYRPIIEHNTPLPVTRTESYSTVHPGQTAVQLELYQGEDEDALRNIPLGEVKISGLTPDAAMDGLSEVLCRMSLSLDGILEVTATEKKTGLSKHVTIANALTAKSADEIAKARERLRLLSEGMADGQFDAGEDAAGADEVAVESDPAAPAPVQAAASQAEDASQLLARSRALLGRMHEDDREEAVSLHEAIEAGLASGNEAALAAACAELREMLFFLEGR